MLFDRIAETLACHRLATALVLVAGCLAGCAPAPPPPSFLLLSLDAVRSDHVGAYGYERDTTPFIDSLARRGFLFEQAVAPSGNTAPSG